MLLSISVTYGRHLELASKHDEEIILAPAVLCQGARHARAMLLVSNGQDKGGSIHPQAQVEDEVINTSFPWGEAAPSRMIVNGDAMRLATS
jgi:hypothetical protein